MTNQEKLEKFEALQTLKNGIAGCFGSADYLFANHPLDEDRAKELRKLATTKQISLSEIQDIVAGYLFRSGVIPEHLKAETRKASEFFAKSIA